MVPATHDTAHVPDEHTWPDGHELPHIPQLPRSVARSRQAPAQFVVPEPQDTAHAPPEHS